MYIDSSIDFYYKVEISTFSREKFLDKLVLHWILCAYLVSELIIALSEFEQRYLYDCSRRAKRFRIAFCLTRIGIVALPCWSSSTWVLLLDWGTAQLTNLERFGLTLLACFSNLAILFLLSFSQFKAGSAGYVSILILQITW